MSADRPLIVYTIITKGSRKYWVRIGSAARDERDGDITHIQLDALPVNGSLLIRPASLASPDAPAPQQVKPEDSMFGQIGRTPMALGSSVYTEKLAVSIFERPVSLDVEEVTELYAKLGTWLASKP